ncbi:MAG: response regulator [Myxococcaceae bacterium]
MPRILIVEDEEDLANLLRYNFNTEGFETEACSTAATAIEKAENFRPDVVLLDLMLPDKPGSEVIRRIRESRNLRRTAVVMVSAKGQESDRLQGFELGADDYVVKPFSVRELILRVKAVMRRMDSDSQGGKPLEVASIRLDPSRHEVKVSGAEVLLTALEFRLLKTLLERRGKVQTREVLLSDVWGIQADITTRTVDTHIKRLREKLGPEGEIIETVRGVGYKLAS